MREKPPAKHSGLVTTFGKGGKVFTSIGKKDLYGSAVAVQADGKIMSAGTSKSVSSVDFALARLNADGSFDQTFGGDGKVTTDFGSTNVYITAIAIQTDGKIVAVGYIYVSGQFICALARYNFDGSLDITFDGDGKVTTDFNSGSAASAVAIQTDGRIVAAGYTNNDFALARYNNDGSLDTSFDLDGKVTTAFGSYAAVYDIAIQANGKIVAGGGSGYDYNDEFTDFTLARYNSDGSLDTNFSGDGKVTTNVGTGCARAVAIQSNGRIIAAGFGYISSDYDFALIRYQSNSIATSDFDDDGKSDISVFRTSDRVWYLNHSTQGYTVVQFGITTDTPVVGDYDGDGQADDAVYRNGTWYVLGSTQGFTTFQFGISTDIPAPADYDGDGRTDAAVFRDGTWYLRQTTSEISIQQFGLANDKPVPAAYLP